MTASKITSKNNTLTPELNKNSGSNKFGTVTGEVIGDGEKKKKKKKKEKRVCGYKVQKQIIC